MRALRSKVKKDKLLREDADCQTVISEVLKLSSKSETSSKAAEMVESRLQSSKVLSEEVKKVVQSLRVVLGDVNATGSAIANTHTSDEPTDILEEDDQKDHDSLPEDHESSPDDSNDDDAWKGFSDNESNEGHGSQSSDSAEESPATESDGSSSPEPSIKKPRSEKGVSGNKLITKAGESTFLPSLSVGFVGGSDSDWSDGESDIADAPVKKNRRGQRARKACVLSFELTFFVLKISFFHDGFRTFPIHSLSMTSNSPPCSLL